MPAGIAAAHSSGKSDRRAATRLIFFPAICPFFRIFDRAGSFFPAVYEPYLDMMKDTTTILPAADRPESYLHLLKGKKAAFVGNQTSSACGRHTLDFLLENGVEVIRIFGPEHGFREMADDATPVKDRTDPVTGLPVVSLFGDIEKPTAEHLKDIEVFVYDIQDTGVRFYTYISTLSFIMEAAGEARIPVVVLDRPNPNGHYVDGNILDPAFASFVGRHPVPIVYGMTVGEYARMMNGQGWLGGGVHCDLTVVPVGHYDHTMPYSLPIKPSPNMPDDKAVNLYPSTCFFEGTALNEGRGTDKPFQVFGSPLLPETGFSYVPMPTAGASEPRFKGQVCHGMDLSQYPERLSRVNFEWLIWAYGLYPDKRRFFIPFFNNLAGGAPIKNQIVAGLSAAEISASWAEGIARFKEIRSRYLLYPDFE